MVRVFFPENWKFIETTIIYTGRPGYCRRQSTLNKKFGNQRERTVQESVQVHLRLSIKCLSPAAVDLTPKQTHTGWLQLSNFWLRPTRLCTVGGPANRLLCGHHPQAWLQGWVPGNSNSSRVYLACFVSCKRTFRNTLCLSSAKICSSRVRPWGSCEYTSHLTMKNYVPQN